MPGSNNLQIHVVADTSGLTAGLAKASAQVESFQGKLNAASASAAAASGEAQLARAAQTTAQQWAASRSAMIASEERATTLLKAGRRADVSSLQDALTQMDAARDSYLASTQAYYASLDSTRAAAFAAQEAAANKEIESDYQRLAARLEDATAVDADTEALGVNTAALTFNAQAQREASYAVGEALTGRYGRLETSLLSLSARTGLMTQLLSPFGVALGAAAAAVGTFAFAAIGGERQSAAFERAVLSTGNAAGLTEGEFNSMAEAITGSNVTIGSAREALTELAQSGKFAGDTLEQAAQGALDFANLTGQSMKEATSAVEQLAEKPAEAIAKLNDQYHFLSLAQFEHISRLQQEGDATGAATAAVAAFASAMHARAQESVADEGLILRGWQDIKGGITGAWDALKGIGRTSTLDEQIAQTKARLAELQQSGVASMAGYAIGDRAALEAELKRLEAKKQEDELDAKKRAQQDAITQAAIAATQAYDAQTAKLKIGNAEAEKRLEIARELEAIHRANPNDSRLKGDVFDSSGALTKGNSEYDRLIASLQEKAASHPVTLPVRLSTHNSEQLIADASRTLTQIAAAQDAARSRELAADENAANVKEQIAERELASANKTLNAIVAANERAARQRAQVWEQSVRKIESAEDGMITRLLTTYTSFSQSARQMAQKLAIDEIQAAAHAMTQRIAFMLEGAAKGKVIRATEGKQTILADAAQAAAGAYKAIVGIPYVGPFLAPAAAAVAFAGVTAFEGVAGFEQGAWEIPRNMVANIHQGETILPRPFAEEFRQKGTIGGGGDTHHWNINTLDAASFHEFLSRPGSQGAITKMVRRLARNGALT